MNITPHHHVGTSGDIDYQLWSEMQGHMKMKIARKFKILS
jgi:hypothetical protein